MSETSMPVVNNGGRHTGAGAGAIQGTLAGSAIGLGGALGLLLGSEVPTLAGWRVAASMAGGTILLYAALGWLAGGVLCAVRVEARLASLGRCARPGILVLVILLVAEVGWWVASGRNPAEYASRHWGAVTIAALASLKEGLETWVRAASAREPATQPPRSEVDDATKERLRALGYAE